MVWVIVFGWSSTYRAVGTVAEKCPHCRTVGPCAVTSRTDDFHVFFIPLASNTTEVTCTCISCKEHFPVEPGRYRELVSFAETLTLSTEELAERTNPAVLEQLALAERRQQFARISKFSAIAKVVEQLGPGQLRTNLMQGLLHWDQLDETGQGELKASAGALGSTLKFIHGMAAKVPGSSGCLVGALTCLTVWFGLMGLRGADYLPGGMWIGFFGLISGPVLGGLVVQLLQRRGLRRWIATEFIPSSEKAGIDRSLLATVIQELPAAIPDRPDELQPLREQAETVVSMVRNLEVQRKVMPVQAPGTSS